MRSKTTFYTFYLIILTVVILPISVLASSKEVVTVLVEPKKVETAPGSEVDVSITLDIAQGWHINSNKPTEEFLIPTKVEFSIPEKWQIVDTKYPAAKLAKFTFAEKELSVYEGKVKITAILKTPSKITNDKEIIKGKVTFQACDDKQCLPPDDEEFQIEVSYLTAKTGIKQHQNASKSIYIYILFGILGGLILNIMPCVLPVLSLKIFSLIKASQGNNLKVRISTLVTSLGIIFSFILLAIFVILATIAGKSVGWGVQFQNPGFVVFLGEIIVLFTLNLWGIFEISPPKFILNALGTKKHEGIVGDFLTGMFATLMATPCSAPFLGTAVSFAIASPAYVTFTIFTAIGVGMSLPFIIIAIKPNASKILPKPGPWMESFKKSMGFLLLLSIVWIFYILHGQLDSISLAKVQTSFIILAFFVWLSSNLQSLKRTLALTLTLISFIFPIYSVTNDKAATVSRKKISNDLRTEKESIIEWEPFSSSKIDRYLSMGFPVFVDVTADWCLTCKVNEAMILNTEKVANFFRKYKVKPLKADWTNKNEEISKFLFSHGKKGVPFYVLYYPSGEKYVFGELISVSEIEKALSKLDNNRSTLSQENL